MLSAWLPSRRRCPEPYVANFEATLARLLPNAHTRATATGPSPQFLFLEILELAPLSSLTMTMAVEVLAAPQRPLVWPDRTEKQKLLGSFPHGALSFDFSGFPIPRDFK